MISILLIALSQIFSETRTSIGKYEVGEKKESIYGMAFLNIFFLIIFLSIISFFREGGFIFSLESLPTFSLRVFLETILFFVGINAIIKADRSTHSFLRIITIPLILIVDIRLGYDISLMNIAGIFLIVLALIFLFINHGFSKNGKFLSLLAAILSVCTLSLYKYDITHFNSVEMEQMSAYVIIASIVVVVAKIHKNENVFRYLKEKLFLFQSISAGLSSVLMSFAYLFAPASIITTLGRSFEILAAMISGKSYFHEKKLWIKASALALITLGLYFVSFY